MKLIVGLGNPGKKYEKTRHNVGFMLLDALHEKLKSYNINEWELSKKFNAQIAGCTINGQKIILAKPMTFMNRSGETVGLIGNYYKLTHENLLIIHDDKDIVLGQIKVHTDRGAAGHNGITSIIDHIGTKDFQRIRVGIKSENEKKMADVAKFVLGKFNRAEKKTLQLVINGTVDEILKMV